MPVVSWVATLKTFYHFIRHIILIPTNTHSHIMSWDTFSFGRAAHIAGPRIARRPPAKSEPPGPLAALARTHLCEKRREKLQVQVRNSCITGAVASWREPPRRGYLPSAPMTLPPHSPSLSNLFPPTITPYGARPTDHQVLWLKRSPLWLLLLAANSLSARIKNSASWECTLRRVKK